MTKFERAAALLGAFGCMVVALFIFLGYFSVPEAGRISPVLACILCTALLWGSGYVVYVVIQDRR